MLLPVTLRSLVLVDFISCRRILSFDNNLEGMHVAIAPESTLPFMFILPLNLTVAITSLAFIFSFFIRSMSHCSCSALASSWSDSSAITTLAALVDFLDWHIFSKGPCFLEKLQSAFLAGHSSRICWVLLPHHLHNLRELLCGLSFGLLPLCCERRVGLYEYVALICISEKHLIVTSKDSYCRNSLRHAFTDTSLFALAFPTMQPWMSLSAMRKSVWAGNSARL